MTYQTTCKDFGINCHFVASGESVDEAAEKLSKHAITDHPAEHKAGVKQTGSEEKMMEFIKSKVHPA